MFLYYGYAVGSSDTGDRRRGFSFGHSGNFQKTHKNLLVYKDKDNYNFIIRNCVQAAVRNLLLGKFKKLSKKLGKELRKLKNKVVPKNTFNTLRVFIINKASKKQRKYFYERR